MELTVDEEPLIVFFEEARLLLSKTPISILHEHSAKLNESLGLRVFRGGGIEDSKALKVQSLAALLKLFHCSFIPRRAVASVI